MGIQVEFNPDLALRRYNTLSRLDAECLPKELKAGRYYEFLKEGQRLYWFEGEIPLLETEGNGKLSRPIASIIIVRATHFMNKDRKIWTRGRYYVKEVFNRENPEVHFEAMQRRC